MYKGQVDASQWESLLHNESDRHALEEVNVLARMPVLTAIA